jgi:hypothetical protein
MGRGDDAHTEEEQAQARQQCHQAQRGHGDVDLGNDSVVQPGLGAKLWQTDRRA